ncbi:MAG: tRNA (5-methylaminomethyl-2-thiouridine)(34)-methyltransferase MnmD [Bacteroidales bacterium]
MPHQRIVQKTEDGWPTFFIPEIDETYHSCYGARTESRHIYIEQGLAQSSQTAPVVLDVGFGTGLNAFETYLYAEQNKTNVYLYAIEKHILSSAEIDSLNIQNILNAKDFSIFKQLHDCSWNKTHTISPYLSIHKIQGDIQNSTHIPSHIDVVYFDAFAPSKEKELWNESVFKTLHAHMSLHGILTTYCVKGDVKRSLKNCGFSISKIPGPPNGKRENLRAVKI